MNLRDLAAHLKLSQTTVSRALNGYPEVSERTRQRVAEAARINGYKPNSSARSLATGKSGSLGHVMPTGVDSDLDLHFSEFLSGFASHAMMRNMDIVMAPATRETEAASYRKLKTSRQVDGVYVSAPRTRDPRIALLNSIGLPFVVHGRSEGCDQPYPFVDIDNEGGFVAATEHLIGLGHQRLALINGAPDRSFSIHRERGVRKSLERAGLTLLPELVFNEAMTERHGYDSTMRLLQHPSAPTAVLCSSMIIALGATRAASDSGLSIGSQLSIIAHDDVFPYMKPEHFRVPLTTTHSSIREAGARIAERLIARIAKKENGPLGEVRPVELIVRNSSGPPET